MSAYVQVPKRAEALQLALQRLREAAAAKAYPPVTPGVLRVFGCLMQANEAGLTLDQLIDEIGYHKTDTRRYCDYLAAVLQLYAPTVADGRVRIRVVKGKRKSAQELSKAKTIYKLYTEAVLAPPSNFGS